MAAYHMTVTIINLNRGFGTKSVLMLSIVTDIKGFDADATCYIRISDISLYLKIFLIDFCFRMKFFCDF